MPAFKTVKEKLADERLNQLLSERRFCYFVDEMDFVEGEGFRVSIVIENEPGRYPTGGNDTRPWYWGRERGDFAEAQATCEHHNNQIGITKEAAIKIIGSSMFPKGKSSKGQRSRRSTPR